MALDALDGSAPRLLTIEQVADLYQVSTKTVYRAIRSGALKACRLGSGGAYRVKPEEMESWIEACSGAAAPAPASAALVTEASPTRPTTATRSDRRSIADGRLTVAASTGRDVMIERRQRRRRDGSTYTVYRVRWWDESGKKRRRTFDRERDAREFDATVCLARRSDDLASLDDGRQTLAELAAEWWEVYAATNLQRRTLPSYASHWNCHVLPRLGGLQLRRITPQTIARFRAELEADGVGDETIGRTLTMLQGMFSRAVEWQLVATNPVKAVRKPPSKRQHGVRAVPPRRVEALRAALLAKGRHDHATLVSVLAYAGVRPEEALALEWRHVRERTLLVEQKNADGEIVTGQKTDRPPRTVELLAALRHDLLEHRLRAGRPAEDALIFPTPRGEPWRDHDYRNWRRRTFQPHAKPCGLSSRPYDLRHSLASLRIQEGGSRSSRSRSNSAKAPR